jgi:pimeloyl-ACP methyl ester carboxylesterase
MRWLRLVGWVLAALLLVLILGAAVELRTSTPLAILIRNTPQLGTVDALLPPPASFRRSVEPTAGDGSLTGVLYEATGPGVLLVNGVEVPGGWSNPDIVTFATSMADAGFDVYVPDMPGGLEQGIVTVDTLHALDADVAWFRQRLGGRRLTLVGICVGASLGVLAAEHQPGDVDAVVGLDPYASLRDLLEAAAAGAGPGLDGSPAAFRMAGWVQADLAKSLAATVPDATLQQAAAEARANPGDDAMAAFRAEPRPGLTPAGAAIWRLLGATDPATFERTYAALPSDVRAQLDELSPLASMETLQAHLLIAAPYNDFAFPSGEATELRQARPDLVAVTRSSALDHVSPAFGPGVLTGYWQLWQFAGAAVQLMSKP